jgi:hypothetical protein
MPDNSKYAIVLRTTSDGAARPLGVVAGNGPSPHRALIDLRDQAAEHAEGAGHRGGAEIEVVDVRLIAGHADDDA